MKKILIVCSLVLFLTGCTNSDLKSAYDKMKIKNIESYSVDIRVNGDYNNEKIKDIYKASNHKDEQIIVRFSRFSEDREMINYEYVFENDKVYKKNENTYEKSDYEFKYFNIGLSLEGLKEIKKINKEYDEVIGDITYNVYEVTYKDKFINTLLKEYGFEKAVKNISGKIYLKEGEIHRIIYDLDNLTLNFLYFSKGNVRKVDIR